jgi:SAM-dependent methyltransferase
MLHNSREYKVMATVEEGHWWYLTLHRKVISTIKKNFTTENIKLLDAGCGTGGFLKKVKFLGYKEASGFDISELAVEICINRGLHVKQRSLTDIQSMGHLGEYHVITCLDALCYLLPDQRTRFFVDAYKLLTPGGLLITNQAALKIFRGTHDRVLGVSYRFNRSEFESFAVKAGFEVTEIYYWPVVLSPVILVARLLQRLRSRFKFQTNEVSDLRSYPRWINWSLCVFLRLEDLVPVIRFFGSSLFVVLRRPILSVADTSSGR